ncbi:hypothetical protein HYV64_05700 [Candidatus Shapirobacteria bacterium]|nr:hypothetical protein [Candidatus Shapirobacteria bacterium]
MGEEINSEGKKLIEEALYIQCVVARTSFTISRGPNGREAATRYLLGALPAAHLMIADLNRRVAVIAKKPTVNAK